MNFRGLRSVLACTLSTLRHEVGSTLKKKKNSYLFYSSTANLMSDDEKIKQSRQTGLCRINLSVIAKRKKKWMKVCF